jgi:hypothetical protein
MEKKLDSLEVTFIVTINYDPSVAQVSLKGKAYVTGDKSEIEKLYKEYEERKPYPPVIMQAISNVVSIEAIVITTKTLNIPPPIPLPQIPAMAGKAPDKKTPVMDYSA